MVARREGEAAGKAEEASPSREEEGEAGPSRGEAEEEAETCRDGQAATASVKLAGTGSDSRMFAVRGRERGTGFTYARDFSSEFGDCRNSAMVRTAVCEKLHSSMVCLRRPDLSC